MYLPITFQKEFLLSLSKYAEQEQKERILVYARRGGCLFCETKDKLTFHHINPGNKVHTVSNLVYNPQLSGLSKYVLIREIRKCVVLCDACHKKIHKLMLMEK
jgi:hypothetical protein